MADTELLDVCRNKLNDFMRLGWLSGAKSWLLPFVLLVHSLLLGYNAYVHSPVTDEIAHFGAGLGHWRFGDFELYTVNPPLARGFGTLFH